MDQSNPKGQNQEQKLENRSKFIENSLQNDEQLIAAEILGRCSKCSAVGTLEFPQSLILSKDAEKVLAYKPVAMKCLACNEAAEFLPIEVKKYTDKSLGLLRNNQKLIKDGGII